ncbi:MAG: hypothetical protein GEV04_07130 [Actinophytocola sp.]|nr:hypothetical protein [Actinophytocola sp.]
MTDRHPSEGLLVDLALDDLDDASTPSRDELLRHLGACDVCRSSYDSIQATLDRTLAAARRVDPPTGFDSAVVGAITSGPVARARGRWPSGGTAFWLAAAVVLGMALGAAGVVALAPPEAEPGTAVTSNSALLRTSDGDPVGTVSASAVDGEPVMVVGVSDAPVSKRYTCRLVLADGSSVDAGRWQTRTEQGWTWVVRVPGAADVVGVELVSDAGTVWSSATLR